MLHLASFVFALESIYSFIIHMDLALMNKSSSLWKEVTDLPKNIAQRQPKWAFSFMAQILRWYRKSSLKSDGIQPLVLISILTMLLLWEIKTAPERNFCTSTKYSDNAVDVWISMLFETMIWLLLFNSCAFVGNVFLFYLFSTCCF